MRTVGLYSVAPFRLTAGCAAQYTQPSGTLSDSATVRRCRLLSSAALLAALGNLTGAATYCMVAWELALGMGDIHACWPIHCAIKLLVRKLRTPVVRSSATDDGTLCC